MSKDDRKTKKSAMRKLKLSAFAMALIMLVPMLMSCSKGKERSAVVKEDDPWYESTRFVLDKDVNSSEFVEGSACICAGSNRIYSLYTVYNNGDNEDSKRRRTLLDVYDDGGTLLNRVEVNTSGNYEISGILAIKSDPEGKNLETVARMWATGGFVTGMVSIDTETGEISEPKELTDGNGDKIGASFVSFSGEYLVATVFTGANAEAHILFFKDRKYVSEADLSAVKSIYMVDDFSYDPSTESLCTVAYTRDGALILEIDPSTGKIRSNNPFEASDEKVDLTEYQTTSTGELCKIVTLGNVTRLDVKSMTPETVVDTNWYSPYFNDLFAETRVLYSSSDRIVIMSKKETRYLLMDMEGYETVTVLKKADRNPHTGKKVIELAMPLDSAVSEYLSNAVYEFNKTDNEYLIRVWEKYKTGFTITRLFSDINIDDEKIYTMIQELKGDEAPDLAIGIQKNYAMRDDVFMDLNGFLDPAVMNVQYQNFFEASKIGSKQYFFPITLEIEGLVTDKSLINSSAAGITFEDFDRMVEEDLNGISPYDYPASDYYNKCAFLQSCMDTKGAIEGDSVDFGSDQFYASVEYAKDHFQYFDLESTPQELRDDITTRFRCASQYGRFKSYLDYSRACYSSDGSYAIIGTPSVDARGPRFRAPETISVSVTTDVTDGCKKFMNFLFSGAGYSARDCEFTEIVTNKDILAGSIANLTGNFNARFSSLTEGGIYPAFFTESFGEKKIPESFEDEFLSCMSTVSTYYYDDPVITGFVAEETAPYFAGDRSLDDVVKYINDRANKYVKEL